MTHGQLGRVAAAVLVVVPLSLLYHVFGRGDLTGAPDPGPSVTLPAADPARSDPQVSPQARDVTARHHGGQTFVTWREVDPVPSDEMLVVNIAQAKRDLSARLRYRIYRATGPIRKLSDAVLVGEVGPLSAWNEGYYGVYPPAGAKAPRYVIEDQKPPLAPGVGLFVRRTQQDGPAFYAVTAVLSGTENPSLSSNNTSSAAVTESVGPGAPVLQRVEHPATFQYIQNAELRFFVRWEDPPNTNIAGKPFDYLVALPPQARAPAPVGIHLHGWGSSMTDGFGWWYNAEQGAILVSSTESPYDWWTGYHEQFLKGPAASATEWREGVVRPYTQNRLLSFVDWLATTTKIDLSRVFAAGNSMGGSGSIMLAIRRPSRIAWTISWVGVHVPLESPQYRASYEEVFGKPEWGVKFEDGTPVWDYFSDAWYLRNHPTSDVGFITFSNGKNDSAIGWRQAVEFARALQDTKQAHMFVWGQNGHGERAYMPAGGGERVNPLDLRSDQSLPAFSRCSLDDDLGSGADTSGAPSGQLNAYLTWKTDSIVDEPNRWAITLALIDTAKESTATVDVTPRRLQRSKVKPGDRVRWSNTPSDATAQSGEVVADQWGLVTIPRVTVTKKTTRLQIDVVR